MKRRQFLEAAAALIATNAIAEPSPIPIIDTHIHLFDPTRPQGVPWPEKTDHVLYKPALPNRYRRATKDIPIAGVIEVECSPWFADNQWVLDIAAKDTLIVGTVGDLEPGKPPFRGQLEQLARNPLFRGIRYGNLWSRDLGVELKRPPFVADLKHLAEGGLCLDSANPDPALVASIVRLTDQVPNLRVVVDHLAQLTPPTAIAAEKAYGADLLKLSQRPQVFVKISQVLRHVDGRVPLDAAFYKSRLDQLWSLFGEDRVIYGSDWPNSDLWGTYPQVLHLVHEYFAGKSAAAQSKYFWKNSHAAYRWVPRTEAQKQLARQIT